MFTPTDPAGGGPVPIGQGASVLSTTPPTHIKIENAIEASVEMRTPEVVQKSEADHETSAELNSAVESRKPMSLNKVMKIWRTQIKTGKVIQLDSVTVKNPEKQIESRKFEILVVDRLNEFDKLSAESKAQAALAAQAEQESASIALASETCDQKAKETSDTFWAKSAEVRELECSYASMESTMSISEKRQLLKRLIETGIEMANLRVQMLATERETLEAEIALEEQRSAQEASAKKAAANKARQIRQLADEAESRRLNFHNDFQDWFAKAKSASGSSSTSDSSSVSGRSNHSAASEEHKEELMDALEQIETLTCTNNLLKAAALADADKIASLQALEIALSSSAKISFARVQTLDQRISSLSSAATIDAKRITALEEEKASELARVESLSNEVGVLNMTIQAAAQKIIFLQAAETSLKEENAKLLGRVNEEVGILKMLKSSAQSADEKVESLEAPESAWKDERSMLLFRVEVAENASKEIEALKLSSQAAAQEIALLKDSEAALKEERSMLLFRVEVAENASKEIEALKLSSQAAAQEVSLLKSSEAAFKGEFAETLARTQVLEKENELLRSSDNDSASIDCVTHSETSDNCTKAFENMTVPATTEKISELKIAQVNTLKANLKVETQMLDFVDDVSFKFVATTPENRTMAVTPAKSADDLRHLPPHLRYTKMANPQRHLPPHLRHGPLYQQSLVDGPKAQVESRSIVLAATEIAPPLQSVITPIKDSCNTDVTVINGVATPTAAQFEALKKHVAYIQPLFEVGRNVRIRHNIFQLRHLKGRDFQVNKHPFCEGYEAINGGSAFADATLYLNDGKCKNDSRNFEAIYGLPATVVWEYRDFSTLVHILNMGVDMNVYGNTGPYNSNNSNFAANYQKVTSRIIANGSKKLAIGSDIEFKKYPDLVMAYRDMVFEHNNALRARQEHNGENKLYEAARALREASSDVPATLKSACPARVGK